MCCNILWAVKSLAQWNRTERANQYVASFFKLLPRSHVSEIYPILQNTKDKTYLLLPYIYFTLNPIFSPLISHPPFTLLSPNIFFYLFPHFPSRRSPPRRRRRARRGPCIIRICSARPPSNLRPTACNHGSCIKRTSSDTGLRALWEALWGLDWGFSGPRNFDKDKNYLFRV